ncbi:Metal-dependent hydrolases of the beta-lactamase superfamily III [Tenacibaculum sp. 190130A14a]|uniref:Ribonuclease Z n=1 Tax=Tenacibaculum polynesiense TaxID=3137857 RepID=A0ABP1F3Q8_9FLAO
MFNATTKNTLEEDISILVKVNNHPWNYLCECGEASKLSIKEIQNCNAIFISHAHIDHFINFDTIIRHQIGIERKVTICGPQHIATQVQHKLKAYTWNLIHKKALSYEVKEMISDNEIVTYELFPPLWDFKEVSRTNSNILFADKKFEVRGTLLDHKTPTLAYKFIEFDTVSFNISKTNFQGGKWVKELKEAFDKKLDHQIIQIEDAEYKAQDLFHLLEPKKGNTLGIIMDHAPSEINHKKIKTHFLNCDTVFIESFYKNEDQQFAELNYHSYAKMSGQIMKASVVKEAIPVHFSRKYNSEEIEELRQEFQEAFTNFQKQ